MMKMKHSLLMVVAILVVVAAQNTTCPCSNATLCEPIKLGPRKEMFAFQLESELWPYYDWSLVTTLGVFGPFDPQMVCKAHANNARVVYATGFPVAQLYNLTAANEWIETQYQRVVETFADGVNVDIEEALAPADAPALTSLIANLSSYFHSRAPYYQVTYDVAWSPSCIDLRCYDYAGLAEVTDFLIMMDYDMRSQIKYGPCVASANSPPDLVAQGLANFTKLNISTDKLVLGLPWYGYDYPCTAISADGSTCSIREVPFRGVNCSDAAGRENAYTNILQLLKYNSTNGYQFSDTLLSPWFNYFNELDNQTHQVWFDDPNSLQIKTSIAKAANMRGVSMWTADFVPYQSDEMVVAAMWGAMRVFFD